MTYNAEQITYMLAEAIDQNREYKSWHCSTQHLMTLAERVRNETLEEVAKEFDSMKAFGDTSASFAAYVRGMKQ
jgi:uncharacterized surface protein with fasciclin (FAS1) repeats